MRCAVVGCGLAGLGAAHALVKLGVNVTLFDFQNVGENEGGIEVGLMHPYPGKKGLLSKNAHVAIKKSLHLIDKAEEAIGEKVALRNGILRKNWDPDEWPSDLEKTDHGILITSGCTVFLKPYLKGLLHALPDSEFVMGALENEDEFDQILYAIGKGFRSWDLPEVQFVKGQALICEEKKPLTKSIIGSGHISPLKHPGLVQIGATYEHNYASDEPNLEAAKTYLAPRIKSFIEPLDCWKIKECRSGIRVCHKTSYLPVIKRIDDKRVIFTGLGSRGLLYHAHYGEIAADYVTGRVAL